MSSSGVPLTNGKQRFDMNISNLCKVSVNRCGCIHGTGRERERERERKRDVTIAAGDGKEACDLVAEGGIVGVFHDGHQLDGVVSQLLDAGENIDSEF